MKGATQLSATAAAPQGGDAPSKFVVCVRVRPENEKERTGPYERVVRVVNPTLLAFDPAPKQGERDPSRRYGPGRRRYRDMTFGFDRVFEPAATQMEVYRDTAAKLVPPVLEGYNATMFAYGATGAGKTHTMLGNERSGAGLIGLTVSDLIAAAKRDEGRHFSFKVGYLEIYNENIRDLLPHGFGDAREEPGAAEITDPYAQSLAARNRQARHLDAGPRKSTRRPNSLNLRESADRGAFVQGLNLVAVESPDEVTELIRIGTANRTQCATAANSESSRSHAVLQILVESRPVAAGVSSEVTFSKLSMIDLAGSERASRTLNRGARLREGANINRSLLALGNCINALCRAGQASAKARARNTRTYIPYRESKLTRLLKDSLGGKAWTVMISNVSPSSYSFDDTLNTLNYADRAKSIRVSVRRNVRKVARHITEYGRVVETLKQEVTRLTNELQEARAREAEAVSQLAAMAEERDAAVCAKCGGVPGAAGEAGIAPRTPAPAAPGSPAGPLSPGGSSRIDMAQLRAFRQFQQDQEQFQRIRAELGDLCREHLDLCTQIYSLRRRQKSLDRDFKRVDTAISGYTQRHPSGGRPSISNASTPVSVRAGIRRRRDLQEQLGQTEERLKEITRGAAERMALITELRQQIPSRVQDKALGEHLELICTQHSSRVDAVVESSRHAYARDLLAEQTKVIQTSSEATKQLYITLSRMHAVAARQVKNARVEQHLGELMARGVSAAQAGGLNVRVTSEVARRALANADAMGGVFGVPVETGAARSGRAPLPKSARATPPKVAATPQSRERPARARSARNASAAPPLSTRSVSAPRVEKPNPLDAAAITQKPGAPPSRDEARKQALLEWRQRRKQKQLPAGAQAGAQPPAKPRRRVVRVQSRCMNGLNARNGAAGENADSSGSLTRKFEELQQLHDCLGQDRKQPAAQGRPPLSTH